MPHLSRILVYPIKSMDGVSVSESELTAGGALGFDRRWAFFDENDRTVNAKKYPAIQQIRADFQLAQQQVTFETATGRATFDLEAESNLLEQWASDYFGKHVFLRRSEQNGFPDDDERPGPTVISEASLQEVARWFGLTTDEVRRRFRANLEIGGVEAPFWEDQLCGRLPAQPVAFSIGNVRFEGLKMCARCPVPSRNSYTGQAEPVTFSKEFSAKREQSLPSWASPAQFPHFYFLSVNTRITAGNHIRVGDALQLL
ncbi:hypothetical protein SAMN05421823_103533 [Catalinimonas alkaloidigena]|uniref:MOSC domain-containing protein n=1 Tax=Catalinimonas alkaloidigena TaxID=1075417 RepID=A0A1G9ENG2_9BACT|nr:MOSC N-terminal beta barrel domain-containing protein [Catalinimonas alkaloidigena]SDK77654.1 hypothetical protein SAMN05421823_103533 [Catalinimonas alkaloidigena]